MEEGRGYSAMAEMLTENTPGDESITKQRVFGWAKRGTLNRAGVPFPSPSKYDSTKTERSGLRVQFDRDKVLAWYKAGVPDRYGRGSNGKGGYKTPDPAAQNPAPKGDEPGQG
jgi:hypothetical protein